MLELGLIHEALTPAMRRRNAPEERNSEAYATSMAKREPLRNAVVAAMDAASVDALVFPTLRQLPAIIGEPQRGSNCSLSANTGLPSLTVPVGWSNDLPLSIEMIGRQFDDARLVSLGYAYEQATDHRRAPPSTPPLSNGMAPTPTIFAVRATYGGVESPRGGPSGVEGSVRFTYNPMTGGLDYEIVMFGVARDDVYAVVLRTTDDQDRSYIDRRLSGPGLSPDAGTLMLDSEEREQLEAGALYLEIMTRDHPFGAARGQLVVPGR
jgi:hypothetical protein